MSGQIWKYSDVLDDWDILFAQKEFFTYRDGIEYYGLTEKTITRLAAEAGAIYKIDNKMVRVRRDLFESYLRKKFRKPDDLASVVNVRREVVRYV